MGIQNRFSNVYAGTDETDVEYVKIKIFNGHKGEVNSCCLSKDYQMLVTAADDAKLLIWNVAKQTVLCELVGHTGPVNFCVFTPDNKLIASASYDCSVRLWETTAANCTATLNGHTRSVECVCFSKDGALLCSASWDKLLIVWNVQARILLHKLSGHQDCVKCCSFSYDSSIIGSGCWDGEIRVWRLDSLLSAADQKSKNRKKWQLRNFKEISCDVHVAILKEHSGNVQSIAFSTAGVMALGSWDRIVCLWDPFRAELLKKFFGHTGWVKAVNFSLNSVELVSTADDDTVRVWNIVSGECTKVLPAQTDIAHHCFFSASGNLLASGTAVMS